MVTRVQKWGNSLALRIPRSFAAQAKVAAGTAVDTRSLHAEVQTGRPVGREIW
jgi:hypothetical protein